MNSQLKRMNMKKIFYFATLLALLFTAISCEQEKTVYTLSDKVEASFPSTIVNYQMVAEDGNKIVVEMWRGNTKSAVSVPVTITNNTGGVFTPEKGQFDFADGESIAYLTFSYPDITQFGGEKYQIILTIDEEMVSPGGIDEMVITAQRKLTYKSIGIGTFTSEFFGESWPQEVQKAEEADNYRLPDCYANGTAIEFSVQNGKINFAKQPTGYVHPDYGMTSWDPGLIEDSGIDGNVYIFSVKFVVDAGSFGGFYEVLEMP